MLQEVTATIENCLQLCKTANGQYARFIENPPEDELDIIDWRVNYISLDEFLFPDQFHSNEEVLLFKAYYNRSADFFYELMESNENSNVTERVHLSLATFPELNLFHSFLTAVSPKEVSSINLNIINEALLNKKYHSFYIDSAEIKIDVNELAVSVVSVFINSTGDVLSNKNKDADIKGQLIINSEEKVDFVEDLFKLGVRVEVEVERVR